jgi:flavin reductase (DIM6/NTAB) family NADH-FMN oxidoreductase RutF
MGGLSMTFKEISSCDLQLNPMEMIGGNWWLITSGNEKSGYNTMTASWGHLGSLWERPGKMAHRGLPTAIVYIRPQRYTKKFIDREDIFTLSVFNNSYKKELVYLGQHSGRDEDKVANTKLTPVFAEGTTFFAEAQNVFICRKLYHSPLLEQGFIDKGLITNNYPQKDFHEMYIGEIIKVLSRHDETPREKPC